MKCDTCNKETDVVIASKDWQFYGHSIPINECIDCHNSHNPKNRPMLEIQTKIRCKLCNGTGVIEPDEDGKYAHKCFNCDNGYIYEWITLSDLKHELSWV